MSFNKEAYWNKRNAEKEFQKQWSEWRGKSIEMFGPRYVAANKHLFTQRAFTNYLETLATMQAQESMEELTAQPVPLQVEALLPPVNTEQSTVTDVSPDKIVVE